MTVLINSVSADAESAEITAIGNIIIAVLGTMTRGQVKLVGNIGSGEVTLWRCIPTTERKMRGFGMKAGMTFKVYVTGVASIDNVTVEYINVD
jgi:hypothetical protein